MYVSDSLFFLQHFFTDAEKDENHGAMFGTRLRDILQNFDEPDNAQKTNLAEEDPDKFIDHMVEKSKRLSGIKQ